MRFSEDVLYESLKKVFTTMTFGAVEIPQEERAATQACLCAVIPFGGETTGTMTLRVPREIMPGLARDLLAEDDDYQPGLDEQLDVLGELINVACGTVLDTPPGAGSAFHIGVPITGSDDDNRLAAAVPGRMRVTSRLWMEEGWAELTVETAPEGGGA